MSDPDPDPDASSDASVSSTDGGEGESAYVVVTTTYPTTYGCHRGMRWNKAELIVRSDRDVSPETYESYDEALEQARVTRNNSEWFQDHCQRGPPDSDDDDSDEDDYDDDEGAYMFTNTDQPPYDSADIQNYDNDEEKRIEVMTRGEYEAREAEESAFLKREGMRRCFTNKVRRGVLALRTKDAGRVHYSTPSQPYDIPAELEIEEKENEGESKSPVPPTANASTIKSLMYMGRNDGAVCKFMTECCQEDSDDEAEATDDDVTGNDFLRLLRACTALEELHLKMSQCFGQVSPAFVQKMLIAAPHLRSTLKVLSVGFVQVEPKALPRLGRFSALERLDVMNSFSSEHYQDGFGGGYNFDDDDSEDENMLPYEEPILECVGMLDRLTRLDLGNGDDESRRYLFDYMLSRDALEYLSETLEEQGGEVTMDKENMPLEWTSKERGRAARFHVLGKMATADGEQPEIRALAEEELKSCPACGKRASNRCTGCNRQWYCSANCQRKDFKAHKKLCKITFDE